MVHHRQKLDSGAYVLLKKPVDDSVLQNYIRAGGGNEPMRQSMQECQLNGKKILELVSQRSQAKPRASSSKNSSISNNSRHSNQNQRPSCQSPYRYESAKGPRPRHTHAGKGFLSQEQQF